MPLCQIRRAQSLYDRRHVNIEPIDAASLHPQSAREIVPPLASSQSLAPIAGAPAPLLSSGTVVSCACSVWTATSTDTLSVAGGPGGASQERRPSQLPKSRRFRTESMLRRASGSTRVVDCPDVPLAGDVGTAAATASSTGLGLTVGSTASRVSALAKRIAVLGMGGKPESAEAEKATAAVVAGAAGVADEKGGEKKKKTRDDDGDSDDDAGSATSGSTSGGEAGTSAGSGGSSVGAVEEWMIDGDLTARLMERHHLPPASMVVGEAIARDMMGGEKKGMMMVDEATQTGE